MNEIIDKFLEDRAMTRVHAKLILYDFLWIISEGVRNGERVHIRAFGAFESRKLAHRWRRNPKTGEKMYCPPTLTVKFVPSEKFRRSVASKRDGG